MGCGGWGGEVRGVGGGGGESCESVSRVSSPHQKILKLYYIMMYCMGFGVLFPPTA